VRLVPARSCGNVENNAREFRPQSRTRDWRKLAGDGPRVAAGAVITFCFTCPVCRCERADWLRSAASCPHSGVNAVGNRTWSLA